jgi:hypothetical protein
MVKMALNLNHHRLSKNPKQMIGAKRHNRRAKKKRSMSMMRRKRSLTKRRRS